MQLPINEICCLNPECHNPPVPEHTKFCPNCGVTLVTLRNRYRPIKLLGGGGFGKTYLAEDIDKLNEKCVIKQFAPQISGTNAFQKAKELFLQEAQQLQKLGEHSQIPTLLAYFEENSRLYLVQQFIDGENLLEELEKQGIFSESQIRALLQDLLTTLKVVHEYDVIHRDIKPENIMRRLSDGKLILIDFGASTQLQGTVRTGTVIGTPVYASLEQMRHGKAYPASDLYSLGVTCFHLLTGVHPWDLWQEDGYGWVKNWRNYLQKPINSDLGRILDKLLQKDYQQRYQSAQEVLLDLNRPQIPPTTVPYQHPQVSPSQPLKIKSSRRGFLQVAGLFFGGVAVTVVGQNLFINYTKLVNNVVLDKIINFQVRDISGEPEDTIQERIDVNLNHAKERVSDFTLSLRAYYGNTLKSVNVNGKNVGLQVEADVKTNLSEPGDGKPAIVLYQQGNTSTQITFIPIEEARAQQLKQRGNEITLIKIPAGGSGTTVETQQANMQSLLQSP
ncbi:MAG: protein kinase [Gloeotrichia echinulata GP01]